MKRIIGILCGLFFFLFSFAQETFQKETYISSRGDTLLYRLLRPEVMKPDEKYPLVLFLHGAGERGNDNEKQLVHGGQMWLNPVNREKYPAFILAPQCPETGYWAYTERPSSFAPADMPLEVPVSPIFRTLKELLDFYLAMPQIDKDRIYVMGLSMGGMGTFDMAVRYPEIFAAAIPVCGTVNPARLKAGKSVKFRIFHGDADNVVTPEGSRAAYRALKAIGADVEYIEFPGCNHGSWNPAFNYPDFMEWLFNQKKNDENIVCYRSALFRGAFLTSCTTSGRVSTFVVLPDTQTYLEQCPEVFDSQVDWLVANRKKIDAVFQVGDLTQDNSPVEWAYMQKAFHRVSQAGIPYSVVWGNHDIGSKPGKFSDVHNTAMANKYFPLSDYKQKSYWGGSADGKTLDNYYINLRSGDTDWLVLNLEFGPSDEALQWADSIVGIHPDKLVILNTHAYLYCDSTLHDGKDWWRPQGYGIGKESGRTVNDGAGIWEKLLLKHRNVIAVFCGHVLKSGVGTLVSIGKEGNKVYQMLANYQRGVEGSRLGGEGYLRIVTFNRKTREIDVKTYSTWNKAYHPSEHHNFKFKEVDFDKYLR